MYNVHTHPIYIYYIHMYIYILNKLNTSWCFPNPSNPMLLFTLDYTNNNLYTLWPFLDIKGRYIQQKRTSKYKRVK